MHAYSIAKVIFICRLFVTLINCMSNPGDRRSTTNYGIFLGLCLISEIAKKKCIVARSSFETEYQAMTLTIA
jgi:hypothetical protein